MHIILIGGRKQHYPVQNAKSAFGFILCIATIELLIRDHGESHQKSPNTPRLPVRNILLQDSCPPLYEKS